MVRELEKDLVREIMAPFTYEETIRTFHLFISKDIKKGRISEKLRDTIDIFPTILDLAKINS